MTAESTINTVPHRGRSVSLVLLLLCTAGGIYVGMRWHTTFERWLLPSNASTSATPDGEPSNSGAATKQLWTCGMHPQVIQDHPGDCPICHMKLTPLVSSDERESAPTASADGSPHPAGQDRKIKYWWDPMMNPPYISEKPGKSPMGMDLVPVYEDESASAGATVVIDPVVVQNMGVRTAVVTQGSLEQNVRATATITEPEPGRRDINLRVSGWIQTLYANTEGMAVKKGDPLFDLYSPELQLAIEELISARKAAARFGADANVELSESEADLVSAAELRLTLLDLTAEQVERLGAGEHAPGVVTFLSPVDGHVFEKAGVFNGSAVSAGQLVLQVGDRSTMWIEAKVPEGLMGRIRVGQRVDARVDAFPDRPFEGEVIFIHPHFDEMTRTALVRMAVPNPEELLRRGMFATVDIDVGTSTTTMLVPREAIIDTGESQILFVSIGKGRFEPRRVTMGQVGGQGMVQVLAGVKPGEAVVVSGQFLLDSESRLREAIAKFLGQSTAGAGAPSSMPPSLDGTPAPAPAAAQSRVDATVASYLVLAEALGAAQKDDTPLEPDELINAIHGLQGDTGGLDSNRLVMEAASAAETLKGQPIETQRELFKGLSAAIIAVLDALPPSPTVAESLYVVNCPMAEADWLQRTSVISNPYYAHDMKECGSVVRTVVGAKGAR